MSPQNYCINCKHFADTKGGAQCKSTETHKISLVYGPRPISCNDAREDPIKCGSEGKLFAPLDSVSDVV